MTSENLPGVVTAPIWFAKAVALTLAHLVLVVIETTFVPARYKVYRMYEGEEFTFYHRDVCGSFFPLYEKLGVFRSPAQYRANKSMEICKVCRKCGKFTSSEMGNKYTQCGCPPVVNSGGSKK